MLSFVRQASLTLVEVGLVMVWALCVLRMLRELPRARQAVTNVVEATPHWTPH